MHKARGIKILVIIITITGKITPTFYRVEIRYKIQISIDGVIPRMFLS